MAGTKRALIDILSGVQGWEALLNNNTELLRDFPVPIGPWADADSGKSLTDLEAAFPAAENKEALAIVQDPFGLAISDGSNWIMLPGPAAEEIMVRNETGAQIDAGTVVEVAGLEASPSRPLIQKLSDYANKPLGVVRANIANNAEGVVIRRGFYTSALNGSIGARVYAVKTTGAMQLLATAPTVAQVGILITAGASGVVYVDVPRLCEQALPIYSTGEIDTGVNDQAGNRIYRKVFVFDLANAGTATQAHGITGLQLAAGSYLHIRASAGPGGGPIYILPFYTGADGAYVRVDGTNIEIVSTDDYSTWDAHVVMEYVKTG